MKDVALLPPGFQLTTRESRPTIDDFLYGVAKAVVLGLVLMIALMLLYGFATDGSSPF